MTLFLRNGNHLDQVESQRYDAETELQGLLATHPNLLAGEEIDRDDPVRFLLIRREAPLKGLGVDLLFVDQNAVPTLVEVKRAENPDVRRKVVGQMLDYAANASAEWDAGVLGQWLETRSAEAGTTAGEELDLLEHRFDGAAGFWAQAVENPRSGNVRLVFVADEIPESLQAIIEFLNERMTPTTVLGIEVRQYRTDSGQQLLSSSLLGQTEQARLVKGKAGVRPSVIPVLVQHGHLQLGDELWLRPDVLPLTARPASDDPRLRFTLMSVTGSAAQLSYTTPAGEVLDIQASLGRDHALHAMDPSYTQRRPRAVHDAYSKEPGGVSLGELAEDAGVWNLGS